MRERARSLVKGIVLIFSLGLLYYLFYRITGGGFICPLNRITGLLCPLCGVTRMCVSLLSLDFSSAFYYNAAVMLLFPIWLAVALYSFYRYVRYGESKMRRVQWAAVVFSAAVLLLFCVFRNIFELGLTPEIKIQFNLFDRNAYGRGGLL